VGTDGGRVEPYATGRIQLAVGQRYDLEVLYDEAGTAELLSHVLVADEQGNPVEEAMPMLSVEVAASEREIQPLEWPALEAPPAPAIDREETLVFDVINSPSGVEWTLNGEVMPSEPLFEFAAGETVRLELVNEAGPEHPFHLHGQFFTIVGDGRINTEQPGRKDTVLLPGLSSVEIIATMDNPGRWMAHCHILEHAELGMMGEILVSE
jgi:FtsP/CotA-like multicopper oxidase with cupredoxin domain